MKSFFFYILPILIQPHSFMLEIPIYTVNIPAIKCQQLCHYQVNWHTISASLYMSCIQSLMPVPIQNCLCNCPLILATCSHANYSLPVQILLFPVMPVWEPSYSYFYYILNIFKIWKIFSSFNISLHIIFCEDCPLYEIKKYLFNLNNLQ